MFEQRAALSELLADSSSLRRCVAAVITGQMAAARERAALSLVDRGKDADIDLAAMSFTQEQVLGQWLP